MNVEQIDEILKSCSWLTDNRTAIASDIVYFVEKIQANNEETNVKTNNKKQEENQTTRASIFDHCCKIIIGHVIDAEPLFGDSLRDNLLLGGDRQLAVDVLDHAFLALKRHIAQRLATRFFDAFKPYESTNSRWRCTHTLLLAIDVVLPTISRFRALLNDIFKPTLEQLVSTTSDGKTTRQLRQNKTPKQHQSTAMSEDDDRNGVNNENNKRNESEQILDQIEKQLDTTLQAALGAGVYHQQGFGLAFKTVFQAEFKEFEEWRKVKDNDFDEDDEDDEDEDEDEDDEDEENDLPDINNNRVQFFDRNKPDGGVASFADVCAKLHHLGLMVTSEDLISDVLFDAVATRVRRCVASPQALLEPLRQWVEKSPKQWLNIALSHDETRTKHWIARLNSFAVRQVESNRIESLMDLVREYPDTQGALDDLRQCLTLTDNYTMAVTSLRAQYARRLLLPGANTQDIIDHYIAAINALKYLEPTRVMLEQVSTPVRSYLRQRDDTIRRILVSFTDPESDLYDEFMHGEAIDTVDNTPEYITRSLKAASALAAKQLNGDNDDGVVVDTTALWNPDPIHAAPSSSRSKRATDLVGLLVGIFGTPERFVGEYRRLLSDRLLKVGPSFQIDDELTQLEMFKLRFGDAPLSECGVMLKDIGDSKRTDLLVRAAPHTADVLSCTAVSHLFWPTLNSHDMTPPVIVQRAIEEYQKEFTVRRARREIKMLHSFGTVELEIEREGIEPLSVTCSPLQATVLSAFTRKLSIPSASQVINESRVSLTLKDVAEKCGAPEDVTRSALSFWAQKRVLAVSSNNLWSIMDAWHKEAAEIDVDGMTSNAQQSDSDDDEMDEDDAAADDQRAADANDAVWNAAKPFVLAMLTNLGALPASRINMMLGGFVPGYSRSLDELNQVKEI